MSKSIAIFKPAILAMVAALVTTNVLADPVKFAFNWPDTSFQPHIDVFQELDENGEFRYSNVVQDTMRLVTHVHGKCGSSYRVSAAWIIRRAPIVNSDQHISASSAQPATWEDVFAFTRVLPVDSSKRTFGWHIADFPDVPTSLINFEELGESRLIERAALEGVTPAERRQEDIVTKYELPLYFMIHCRYPPGESHDHKWWMQRSAPFAIHIRFHGVSSDVVPAPTPGEEGGGLTTGVQIESNHLMVLPEERSDSCRIHLTASLQTSDPTVVVYRLRDDKGAVSPEFSVEVDQSGVAFVSHAVDLVAPDDETIDFTAVDPTESSGIAFGDAFTDLPTEAIRGFYRLETSEPHVSRSNFAGYNLTDCTPEQVPVGLVHEAIVIDPSKGGGKSYD